LEDKKVEDSIKELVLEISMMEDMENGLFRDGRLSNLYREMAKRGYRYSSRDKKWIKVRYVTEEKMVGKDVC
jgi:hypothetical protein